MSAFKKNRNKIVVLVVLVSAVLIAVAASWFYQTKKINSIQKQINYTTDKSINESSRSASAGDLKESKSATPAAEVLIPANYGNSVRVPILTYHYIGLNPNPEDKARDNLSVAPDKFDEQMAYIKNAGYTPISLDTMYAALKGGNLPPKPVILTFDDGYIDFYTTAFPIMKKYGLRSVSFIPTGLMNQGYYMSWAQIKEIDSSGLVSFECHSVSHPNLVELSREQLSYQIGECKKELQAQLGKPVNFMAYPFGASNQLVWSAAKDAGFMGSVGTYYGLIESEGNLYNMPRIKVSGAWSIEQFSKAF